MFFFIKGGKESEMTRSVGDLRAVLCKITRGQVTPPKGGVTCTPASFFQKKYFGAISKKVDNFTKMSKR